MGRTKQYRQRLLYQVHSVRKKTLRSQLTVQLQTELGMSQSESELLAERLARFLAHQVDAPSPEQIVVTAAAGRHAFGRRHRPQPKAIRLTLVSADDLDVEEEFGLHALQTARLLRYVEEATAQDALLTAEQLSLLLHLTPTALRGRLQTLRRLGLWVPVRGLARAERERGGVHRSTWLLQKALAGESLTEARRQVGCSRALWRDIQARFAGLAAADDSTREALVPEQAEWHALAAHAAWPVRWVPPAPSVSARTWPELARELASEFGFSPVRVRAVREVLEELRDSLQRTRPPGTVIFWAVACEEPAGKPLEACRLIPVTLSVAAELAEAKALDNPNRLHEQKRARILRCALEAKQQGAYLTYADLSYLLGLHTEAIRRLIETEPRLAVPLRGSEADIGRGTTHRQRIIELYLQMHTETEIVARTGHSYEAIENYIQEFARIFLLWDRGMPAPLIRRVTGRSWKLVQAYLALIQRYHTPEYAFRFQQLRRMAERHDGKKGAFGDLRT